MPVLYGVFLYMGVASLNGVQVSESELFTCLIRLQVNAEQVAQLIQLLVPLLLLHHVQHSSKETT